MEPFCRITSEPTSIFAFELFFLIVFGYCIDELCISWLPLVWNYVDWFVAEILRRCWFFEDTFFFCAGVLCMLLMAPYVTVLKLF